LRYFDRFVQKFADEYAKDLAYVLTLNEPNVYVGQSYAMALWPPQQKNYFLCAKVYWNLLHAHKRAYKILKSKNPSLQIGIAAQLENAVPKRPYSIVDNLAVKVSTYVWNWWFLNRIKKHQDFTGLNYYFTTYYQNFLQRCNPAWPENDLGWYMQPEGIYPLLLELDRRYKKPIIITENGLADAKDIYRKWWLEQTIVAMQRAFSEGIALKGYLHRSLLDNFEWADGWWPKFGLVAVDREHGMKRTVRPSAEWFGKYIARARGKREADGE
jgi:beta-glucosidase